MPATADELTLARSYIGNTESDAVFNERYDRLAPSGTSTQKLNLAIEESIRSQLAALTFDQPAQITVSGDSFNWASNIKALEDALERFQDEGGIPDPEDLEIAGIEVSRLHRPSFR